MSNSLTVRLTVSRSSARRAPISYTPPVNPPPPSTSAVLDRGGRRGAVLPLAAVRLRRPSSRSTTLPIRGVYGPRLPHRGGVWTRDAHPPARPGRPRLPARAGAGRGRSPPPGPPGEAGARDAPRGDVLRCLR